MPEVNREINIQRIEHKKLLIAKPLADFIQQQVLPETGISADHFWSALSDAATKFMPRNKALLAKRDELQQQINDWHKGHQDERFSAQCYQEFLTSIGYIEPAAPDFTISTLNVDQEISHLAGPQLVVPVMNARYALNATNARWGSLYDALYGSDIIPYLEREGKNENLSKGLCHTRAKKVITYAKTFLDSTAPLAHGTYDQITSFSVDEEGLSFVLANGDLTRLADISQFVGYQGQVDCPKVLLLKNNGLHIEIQIDRKSQIGALDNAGICDVFMEAALTCIQDCEDSIAAVDTEDKIQVYKNWLGLMKGDLQDAFVKNGKAQVRTLANDRHYVSPLGEKFSLSGRSLLLIRNVGHLMTTDAVLSCHQNSSGEELPEGILDAFVTSLIALHDLNVNQSKSTDCKASNSRAGSIYIVKPKMHGSAEVAFTCDLFSCVEQALGLATHTIKIGLMDEERRTSVNLTQCLYQARERIAFINTGFMDRTGDEIHTSIAAGIMVPKEAMKQQAWIKAYEEGNVQQGLSAGIKGKGQIGKGMWPIPDKMANMMTQKIAHLHAGANCAWVPSPTAAVLHAMHYHQVNVKAVQQEILTKQSQLSDTRLAELLTIPLKQTKVLTETDIQQELSNNIQGILGYVVRWVELGIGCSKVPDINDVGLMEDRATLRISCQHVANWLMHDVITTTQIRQTMETMAIVVDKQNISVIGYKPMSDDFELSLAFNAAFELITKGAEQPSGYTEPLLHHYRRKAKHKQSVLS
ncbi:MAG: malate synthase G [Saccharospirillaceae bacterium]|nr:malate synthase G [Colwellia sp.]NRB77243.1 malate synthase G [Saccharospirillaceae bacterium]